MPRRGVPLPSLPAHLGRASTLPPRRLRLTASPLGDQFVQGGRRALITNQVKRCGNMLPTADGIPEEYRAALLVWLQHLPIPYDERCKIDISSIPIA
jgi:hypothetical protein